MQLMVGGAITILKNMKYIMENKEMFETTNQYSFQFRLLREVQKCETVKPIESITVWFFHGWATMIHYASHS